MNNTTNETTNRIYKVAKEKHITITKMEQDLGLAAGFICSRKYSKTFPFEVLTEVANYLGKPIWYFDDACRKYTIDYIMTHIENNAS